MKENQPPVADDTKTVPLAKLLEPVLVLGQAIKPRDGDVDASVKTSAGHEVFCVRYSPDGQFVAASRGNGNVDVYSATNGNLVYTLPSADVNNASPTCCIRFRPNTASSKTRNVLLAVDAGGVVKHWHMTSMKCLHTTSEDMNQIYALDYRPDGLKFATAGQDYQVRLYDEATKSLQSTLTGGLGYQKVGHSNRIFSLKFASQDEHMLLSAGWDNTVQVWDVRVDRPQRSIFGAHITGDAMDQWDNYVLTGSWRPEGQLQLWDLRTCKLVKDYNWVDRGVPTMLYGMWRSQCFLVLVRRHALARCGRGSDLRLAAAAQFSRDPQASMVLAGGSGANEARVYARESGECRGIIKGMHQGVYSLDCHPQMSQVAVASGDGAVRLVNIPKSTGQ